MRLKFKNRLTKFRFYMFIFYLIVVYLFFAFPTGMTYQAALRWVALCWSAPFALVMFLFVRGKYIWLEVEHNNRFSQHLPLVTQGLVFGIPVAVFIISLPVATFRNNMRCSMYRPQARLAECELPNAKITNKDLHNADMDRIVLDGANLEGSNLRRATLPEASLHGANLTNVNLTEVDLSNSDMSEANLTGATLTGAILLGADLHDAIGVTNEMLASAVDTHGLVLEDRREMAEKLGAACRGEAVPEAKQEGRPYTEFNPIIVLDDDGSWSDWTRAVPSSWWPARANEAYIVACVGESVEEERDACVYSNGGAIKKIFHGVEIRLVNATTGETYRTVTAWGDAKGCPSAKISNFDSKKDMKPVSAANITAVLESTVNPDGTYTPVTVD